MLILGWHILNSGYKACLVADSRMDKLQEAKSFGFDQLHIDPREPDDIFLELLKDPSYLPLYTSNDQCVKNLNFMLNKAGYFACSQESIEDISDKYKVLSKLKRNGLVKRRFDLKPLKVPHFSKPRKGASSVGVKFLVDEVSMGDDRIYEEPLLGVEYSIDGLIDGNGNAQVAVGKKFKINGDLYSPISTSVIYNFEFPDVLSEYFFKVITTLNLKNTAVHGEVILTHNGPELVEISARQTGMTGSIILPHCGINFSEDLRKIQLGELHYDSSDIFLPKNSVIYFFYERVGFLFDDYVLRSQGFSRLIKGNILHHPIQLDDLKKTGFEVLRYEGNQRLHSDEINNILRWIENA